MKQRLVEPMLTEYLHRKASITKKTPISGTFELITTMQHGLQNVLHKNVKRKARKHSQT